MKIAPIRVLFCWVFMVAALAACSGQPPSVAAALSVDGLMNAEYHTDWAASGVAQLSDGAYQEGDVEGLEFVAILAYPDRYAFGDINGDGLADGVMILATSGGGSGTFISLEVLLNESVTPWHAASYALGDRVVVKSVQIKEGEIVLTMIVHGPDDGLCCPSQNAVQRFQLQENAIVMTADER